MSDQDFFFDEDEKPSKPAAQAAPAKKGSSSGSGGTGGTGGTGGAEQAVSLTVTVLVAVVAALLGVIIGLFIGRGMAAPAVVAPAPATGTQQPAPQLSPEQLEGNALPEGHPDIGGLGGGSGAPTETPEAEGETPE